MYASLSASLQDCWVKDVIIFYSDWVNNVHFSPAELVHSSDFFDTITDAGQKRCKLSPVAMAVVTWSG